MAVMTAACQAASPLVAALMCCSQLCDECLDRTVTHVCPACRSGDWPSEEVIAYKWHAAVLLCSMIKQLEDAGYEVCGAGL